MFYDSSMYSTPLSLLQLPPTALPEVTQKLTQPGNTTARFSQDGKGLEDLQGVVSPADYQQAAEAEVDVGYVCKKCQLVHPAEALCLSHQRSSGCCGKEPAAAVLRLVQVQLECRACRERLPTLLDFKFHCSSERHVKRLHRLQQQNQRNSPLLPQQNQPQQQTGLHKLQQQNQLQQQTGMHKLQLPQQNQTQQQPPTSLHKVQQLQQQNQPQQTDMVVPMKPPSCSTSSHFAATPVAPSMTTPPRLAPPPLLLPQTGNDVAARNGGPDVAAQHLLFSSDFRNDLDAALRLGLEASSTPLDALPAAKAAGICYGGEATLSPETKRL